MPISIGQWCEGIGIFNSYKYKTPFKCVHSNFVVNLLLYKLITIMFVCCLHEILDYCDYFDKLLDCLLIFILVTDNFSIQVFHLIIPVIDVHKSLKTKLLKISYFLHYCLILNYFTELSLNLLLQHGDIKSSPGPSGKRSQHFSFCQWNLNSLPAHNYVKVPLLKAFNTLHKLDLICLSETYFDSLISIEEKSHIIDDYKLNRADHPSDTKRGRVYHKEAISVQVLKELQLPECLVYEVSIQNKRDLFITLYHSPNQSHDCFQTFLKEFNFLSWI